MNGDCVPPRELSQMSFEMFGLAARQHAFRAAEGPVLRPVGDSLPLYSNRTSESVVSDQKEY